MMPSVERLRFNATVNKALELSAELPPIAGNPEIWLSAHLVACTLFPKLKGSMTSTIFKRSRGGLLRARAQSIIIEDRPWREDAIVPIQFWSSDDPKDENCNWTTGDFETRVDSASSRLLEWHFIDLTSRHHSQWRSSILPRQCLLQYFPLAQLRAADLLQIIGTSFGSKFADRSTRANWCPSASLMF